MTVLDLDKFGFEHVAETDVILDSHRIGFVRVGDEKSLAARRIGVVADVKRRRVEDRADLRIGVGVDHAVRHVGGEDLSGRTREVEIDRSALFRHGSDALRNVRHQVDRNRGVFKHDVARLEERVLADARVEIADRRETDHGALDFHAAGFGINGFHVDRVARDVGEDLIERRHESAALEVQELLRTLRGKGDVLNVEHPTLKKVHRASHIHGVYGNHRARILPIGIQRSAVEIPRSFVLDVVGVAGTETVFSPDNGSAEDVDRRIAEPLAVRHRERSVSFLLIGNAVDRRRLRNRQMPGILEHRSRSHREIVDRTRAGFFESTGNIGCRKIKAVGLERFAGCNRSLPLCSHGARHKNVAADHEIRCGGNRARARVVRILRERENPRRFDGAGKRTRAPQRRGGKPGRTRGLRKVRDVGGSRRGEGRTVVHRAGDRQILRGEGPCVVALPRGNRTGSGEDSGGFERCDCLQIRNGRLSCRLAEVLRRDLARCRQILRV